MNKLMKHVFLPLLCAALLPLSPGVHADNVARVAKQAKPSTKVASNTSASIPFKLSSGETVRFRALQEVAGCHKQQPVILVKRLDEARPGAYLMVGCSSTEVNQYGEGQLERMDNEGHELASAGKGRMGDYLSLAKDLAGNPDVQGLLALARTKLESRPPVAGQDESTLHLPTTPGAPAVMGTPLASVPANGPTIVLGNAVNLESLGRDDHVSIRFQPAPDAAIDPGTVKVLIGGKDKTLQFRMIADISERGIEASLKHVPAGRQEVQISVQDTKKREAVLKAMVNIKA